MLKVTELTALGMLLALVALPGSVAARDRHPKPANIVAAPAPAKPYEPQSYETDILGADATPIGHLIIRSAPNGALLELMLREGALSPGWHGIHIHEKADCSDAGFKLSGGHIGHAGDPALVNHGLLNPKGSERGDLPNLFVGASGEVRAEFFSTQIFLGKVGDPLPGNLRDADGSALVIHANRDDQLTAPIGGAGARLACAAIR